MGSGFEAPSVEAVSAGRWHYTADQCKSLISILQERMEEACSGEPYVVSFFDEFVYARALRSHSTSQFPERRGLDGGLDSSVENQGYQMRRFDG